MNIKASSFEIVLESMENFLDNKLLDQPNSILQELLKAFPFVNALKTGYDWHTQYQANKRSQQFLYMIHEFERADPGKILKIFEKKSNLEMGLEVMNALESSYLEEQARMIARVTLLYDEEDIDKDVYLKYMNIIPKLDSYLLGQIEECYKRNLLELTRPRHGVAGRTDEDLSLELKNYGFVDIITHPLGGKEYKATTSLLWFYENIFQKRIIDNNH